MSVFTRENGMNWPGVNQIVSLYCSSEDFWGDKMHKCHGNKVILIPRRRYAFLPDGTSVEIV